MSKKSSTTTAPKVSNYAKNRQARLLKHLKIHPNDINAQEILANSSANNQPTRKASKEKSGWLTSNKSLGELIKSKFTGTVTKEEAKRWAIFVKTSKKVMFWKSPVAVFDKEGNSSMQMKHISTMSNFKGKITKRVAALKGSTTE